MKDAADIGHTSLRGVKGRVAYLRDLLSPVRPLRIADVGANPVNVPAYQQMLDMQACEVWGFEPDDDAFAALEKTDQPGTHFVQRAVGKSGPGTFYPHQATGMGSLFKVDEASVSYLGRHGWFGRQREGITLDLISLDDIPEDELPPPDLLKMDIQGGELDVLRTGRQRLSEAVAIIPELRFAQIYVDEPMWSDVDHELRDQGFILHKLVEPKAMSLGTSHKDKMRHAAFRNQLVDGDAVYIRDPRQMDGWSEEQVKQLAIAAAGVFDSLDLTIFCLDHLTSRGALPEDASKDFFNSLPKWLRKPG